MVRDTVDADWRPLHEVGQEDALSTAPLAFGSDGDRLLMITSRDANAGRAGCPEGRAMRGRPMVDRSYLK